MDISVPKQSFHINSIVLGKKCWHWCLFQPQRFKVSQGGITTAAVTTSFNTHAKDSVKPYTNLPSSIYIITGVVTFYRPHLGNVTVYCTRVMRAEGTGGGGRWGASGLSPSLSSSLFYFLLMIVRLSAFLPHSQYWVGLGPSGLYVC